MPLNKLRTQHVISSATIVFAAFPALADDEDDEDEPMSACPIDTTQLEENMANRFVYTALAGFDEYASYQRYATSEMAASAQHAIPAEWTCVTWSVELLLLESHVAIDGAGGAARKRLDSHFNGGANPVVIDGVTDSHGRWTS